VLAQAGLIAAPGPTTTSLAFHQLRPTYTWPLYLTLRLSIPAGQQMGGRPAGPEGLAGWVLPSMARSAETLVLRLRQREQAVTRRETQLVERLLARRESREESASPAGSWTEAAPPPPRVVSRPAAPSLPVEAARPAPAAPLPALAYWSEAAAATQPAPVIDVERLAEQVIESFDRRVIAARERLGIGRG
jgi:hypothetical protein